MVELFFKALFRLGICATDWEVWYGTKPLVLPGQEHRSVVVHPPTEPSPLR